jgi:hypothetical protein
MSRIFQIAILFILIISCERFGKRQETLTPKDDLIFLETLSDSLHSIVLSSGEDTSRWELPYPVYRFICGDVDGDGIEDILVGVIKPTRFHPIMAKRLFIFKNFEGYIRPMWLGSVFPQPLIDFWLIKNEEGYYNILTFEREESGRMLVAEYRWRGFGIDFITYHAREIKFR